MTPRTQAPWAPNDPKYDTGDPHAYRRWECRCQLSPVLLGNYVPNGLVIVKHRDRFYRIDGTVRTVCPRCGATHELDPASDPAALVRDPRDPQQAPR